MKKILCFIFLFIAAAQCIKESDVQEFTEKYERFTFSQTQIKKRYADNFELNIQIEGKDLTLVLSPNYQLTQSISFETRRSFLKGFVKGFEDSIVRLSMEDNFLEGIIIIGDDSIYVENIETNEEGHNTAFYKASNIKRDEHESLKSRCKQMESVLIGPNEIIPQEISRDSAESFHSKRNTIKDCKIAIVADIKFFGKYGTNSTNAMVSIINAVEGIYLKQLSTGLPIVYTYIVKSTTDPSGLGNPSNSISTLLSSFRTVIQNRNLPNFPTSVCLAHLFTYQDFSGTLGLAYVGSSATNIIGGICSSQGCNTGVSSFFSFSRETSTAIKIATVAHEMGHNFGSKHDTEHPNPPGNLPECNPTYKYLMYPSVNTGINAQTFSTCSLYSIKAVIAVKSTCFTTRTTGPTTAPTTAPPTTAPPTTSPTTKPPTTSPSDQCATDPRVIAFGVYVACPFQPSGFNPCILFCAKPGVTNQCTYFFLSNGQNIFKYPGSSCGTGKICSSTGVCVLSSAISDPDATTAPTRAPTLPPTTSPTSPSQPPSTLSPQPQCPDWAPIECSTNDCQLRCSYDSNCFLFDNRPDGTHCGGSGKCISGACRPISSGVISKECNPDDACCDANGNLRPHGYVCRPSENSCDIEEICNPQNPRPSLCPEDDVMPGGTPCNCSDLYDPSSCTSACGINEYKGVCGNVAIESCQGKNCEEGFECSLLKGFAKCIPKAIGSCQNNCGKSAALTVGCFCDESCKESDDCCKDYEDFCVVAKDGSVSKTASWVWGVVGAVIALAVVAVIAGVAFFLYKKKKNIGSV